MKRLFKGDFTVFECVLIAVILGMAAFDALDRGLNVWYSVLFSASGFMILLAFATHKVNKEENKHK